MSSRRKVKAAAALAPHCVLVRRVEIFPGVKIGVGGGDLGYHDFGTGNDRAFDELLDGTQSVGTRNIRTEPLVSAAHGASTVILSIFSRD